MSAGARSLGVLILGCGWAARIHSRTLGRLPGVRLLYASRDLARAAAYSRRFGGAGAFASYEEGLAARGVDVALVATPTATHRTLALLALDAGKHVIVEKPAFMRAAEVGDVRSVARAAGRRVLVAENYAYKPITALLRGLVAAGDLGEVRFVTLNATKRQPPSGWRAEPALSGGGALFEGGVHWISFAAGIGLDVDAVHALRAGPGAGSDRSTLVVFRYANGAVGTLAHSWELRAPLGGLRLSKVQGTRGAVTFESNGLAALVTGRRTLIRLPFLADPLGYRAMHVDFLRALRTGGPPGFTLEMAERDLRLLEMAARSMGAEAHSPGALASRGPTGVDGPGGA